MKKSFASRPATVSPGWKPVADIRYFLIGADAKSRRS
jgi:hypothetical protein